MLFWRFPGPNPGRMSSIDGHDDRNIADHSRLGDRNIQHPVINFHLEKRRLEPVNDLPPVHAGGKVSDEVSSRQLGRREESELSRDLGRGMNPGAIGSLDAPQKSMKTENALRMFH